MASNAIAAFGLKLQRGDGADPEVFTLIAEIKKLTPPKFSADQKDVTTHASDGGWEEIITTILRSGVVVIGVNWIPTNSTQSNQSGGILNDFTTKTKSNYQLVWPDSGGTTWSFSARVVECSFGDGNVADGMDAEFQFKITGQPTLAYS